MAKKASEMLKINDSILNGQNKAEVIAWRCDILNNTHPFSMGIAL